MVIMINICSSNSSSSKSSKESSINVLAKVVNNNFVTLLRLCSCSSVPIQTKRITSSFETVGN